ncbi:hypothetical protein L7F22_066452 [Adiantum nelumboides]|nr:hypothetical protein [Adiantum nelumboides]
MNIVASDAADTLPIIFDRGWFGMYLDWCESFSTYPRTYHLLHVDHLFGKLKKRCKPKGVIAEVDRILRPRGWVIVRDKSEADGYSREGSLNMGGGLGRMGIHVGESQDNLMIRFDSPHLDNLQSLQMQRVLPDEDLAEVAEKFETYPEVLMEANRVLNPVNIATGELLWIPWTHSLEWVM